MIAELALAGAGALAWGTYNPRSRLFGPVVRRGDPARRSIYLTFDDGPNPEATPAILDMLDRAQVPAAFFLVGQHVERFPQHARDVVDAGHTVGNHTWSHAKLHGLGPKRIAAEIGRCHRAIVDLAGIRPRAFRAPHGYRNPFVQPCVTRYGYRTVAWTEGVWDTSRPGAEVIRARVARMLAPGCIVLLHDGDGYDPRGDRRQTAAALEGIIRDARARGYEFRPLPELLT